MKSMLAAAALAVAVTAAGAGSAFAGEVTGNGQYIAGSNDAPLNGKSACAYSGLNDNYVFGNHLPDADGFTHTQSWGQVDKLGKADLTSHGLNPGIACNPTKATGGGE